MLILLPPSEGKAGPASGPAVSLDQLSFPELTGRREEMLAALVDVCRGDPHHAANVLGLGPTQAGEVSRNAALITAPVAPAGDVYTGVLFDAMALSALDPSAGRRADRCVVVTSALWGLVRPTDRIPAYRLGGGVTLPGIGPVAAHWRSEMRHILPATAGDHVVVDLRSTTYQAFWRPDATLAEQTVRLRVLHEQHGRRTVVSHHSKATKGRVARDLLTSGVEPGSASELADALAALGWKAELARPRRTHPWTLDIVIS